LLKPGFKGIALLLAALLGGCAGSASVQNGAGDTITTVQGEAYDGPKARVVVGRIIDRSADAGKKSLTYQLGQLLKEERVDTEAVLGGMRDMLTDAMFNTGRFILLDRELLDAALVEQEFLARHETGNTSDIPGKSLPATLEGADLLVVGALTSFDAGANGGIAFPIPIPLNSRNSDFGILNVQMRTAAAAIDIRVIDVHSGRVVSTVAVEGKARKFGAGLTGVFSPGGGYIRLPGILSAFENTPVEKALRDMVQQASQHIAGKTPDTFFRYREDAASPPSKP
jgi:curli biogenesis system outer membrane secretion channel CsgG